ncbi:MAG: 30S ribosomal protein S5 [Patescibacteria group bacterium]|nr:30S ribosomal protein S5 [Patescibacteria group bacterium]
MEQQRQERFKRNRRESQDAKPKDEFESKVLDLARVTKVTGGGKQLRFRAVVVVGNKKGKIGVGVAKGADVSLAVEKSTRKARKNLIEVPMIGQTIPHEVFAKYGPARVLLRSQAKGRGLVAGGQVRVICSLIGIKDVSSKLLSRSRNKLNIAMATIAALKKLKIKSEKRETAVQTNHADSPVETK